MAARESAVGKTFAFPRKRRLIAHSASAVQCASSYTKYSTAAVLLYRRLKKKMADDNGKYRIIK